MMSLSREQVATYELAGYQMINKIEIRNYKCFEKLKIEDCSHINILVGDNGAGKTALLEAIFFALAGNAQIALRNRQARGFNSDSAGSIRTIEQAWWGDLFHKFNADNDISIILSGNGPEARSVFISKGAGNTVLPLGDVSKMRSDSGFRFLWRSSAGEEFDGSPSFADGKFSFPPEREDLPDFFYFSSTHIGGSTENATRFSELSKARKQRQFVELFVKEYPWIEDLSIEVIAGQPVIHATLKDAEEKIPLNSISSGINRILSVLLVMASHPRSVVLVDEIENGLYYKHQQSFWRWLLSFAKTSGSQLFLSTHSNEWLTALIDASDATEIENISLWRLERNENGQPEIFQFGGEDLRAGVEYGAELRGGSE